MGGRGGVPVRKCAGSACSSLRCVYSSLGRIKKRQTSAALSYSDMTQAMSTTSDGCSSFNCMSELNDGIVNSYTFCPIAFQCGEGLERRLRLAVAIWGGASPLHHTGWWGQDVKQHGNDIRVCFSWIRRTDRKHQWPSKPVQGLLNFSRMSSLVWVYQGL